MTDEKQDQTHPTSSESSPFADPFWVHSYAFFLFFSTSSGSFLCNMDKLLSSVLTKNYFDVCAYLVYPSCISELEELLYYIQIKIHFHIRSS